MKIIEALKKGEEILNKNNIEDAMIDSRLILQKRMKLDRAKLICKYNDNINPIVYFKYMTDIKRRARHIPVAYIIHEREFMNKKFYVNKNVLIPRPDTEVLVVEAIHELEKNKKITGDNEEKNNNVDNIKDSKRQEDNYTVIDMCTGSGCIAISIASHFLESNVYAIDISKKALKVANKNVDDNKIKNVKCVHSDLFSMLYDNDKNNDSNFRLENKVDMIVSNPPYIKTEIVKTLESDVKDYEPNLALDGGEDGIIFYVKIMDEARCFLKDGGILAFEIDYTYYDILKEKLVSYGYSDIKLYKDLNDLDRVIIARYYK